MHNRTSIYDIHTYPMVIEVYKDPISLTPGAVVFKFEGKYYPNYALAVKPFPSAEECKSSSWSLTMFYHLFYYYDGFDEKLKTECINPIYTFVFFE